MIKKGLAMYRALAHGLSLKWLEALSRDICKGTRGPKAIERGHGKLNMVVSDFEIGRVAFQYREMKMGVPHYKENMGCI